MLTLLGLMYIVRCNQISRCIWSLTTANPEVCKSNSTTKVCVTNPRLRNIKNQKSWKFLIK